MDEHLLDPPDRWTDDLRTLTLDSLALSCHNRIEAQLPTGRTLADVEDDLAGGAWLVRRRNREDEFTLGGRQFELRVKARLAEQGRHPIAQVLNVDEARSVPRRVGWLAPRRVDFHNLWDEAPCDLAALETELGQRLALTDNARKRPRPQRELELHQELHRVARREYGDLSTLITLLEQRPVKAERTVAGVVASSGRRGRQQLVVVETGASGLAEFRGKRVSLRLPDGRTFNTRVVRVQERQLHIAEPQDWSGRRNDLVDVAGIPPFGLRRNGQALEDFLAGRVEGSWHDLARLVCRPDELALPPLTPPQTFYCDVDPEAHQLNEEQRLAVTGAVESPHGFLIQGPPGTGKTEVISETIQQLVGRGKRVLLLAPAHVAVDEVLKRVGSKPGMRPLRITFDDNKVDESVRGYLPQHVGIELINRVLRPTGSGRAERWVAELDVVERRLAALVALRSAENQVDAARQALRASSRRVSETDERLASYQAWSSQELARANAELAAAQRRHGEAKAADDELSGTATATRAEWESLLPETRAAADELSAAARADADWSSRVNNAARAYQAAQLEHADVLDRHDEVIGRLREEVAAAHRSVTAATEAAAAAERELRQAETTRSGVGRLVSRVGIGQAAQLRRELRSARASADQLQEALRISEARLTEAVGRRVEVDGRGGRWLVELRDTVERNSRRAENAVRQRAFALRRMLDTLARYGDPGAHEGAPMDAVPTGDHATATSVALADAVIRVLAAVTQPVRAERLDPWLGPDAFGGVLADFLRKAERLRHSESVRSGVQRELLEAEAGLSSRMVEWRSVKETTTEQLRQRELADRDARALLERHQAEATRLGEALAAATDGVRALGVADTPDELARAQRRRLVLPHLPALERRWRELLEDRTDDQLADDIRTSALRATNLVCATTKGIVGRGSDVVRDTDYDTLIVDEASRVTDSEFLIGAVRARRWVLVGDERQLPPHVDQEDEHFLHALFALYRHHRGESATLDEAVNQLAEYWKEDAELREFRTEAVARHATELVESGLWEATLRARVEKAYGWFDKRVKSDRGGGTRRDAADEADPDRALLRTMNEYLVRSLFERVVEKCGVGLKQPLKWQRRMPEPLSRIVRGPVYGGDYLSPPDEDLAQAGARPLVLPNTFDQPAVFIDTSRHRREAEDSSVQGGHGFVNELEQRLVLQACRIYHRELDRIRSPQITVSVLSFYRAQARALDDALDRRSFPLFDIQVVDVVDRIQGQQSDLVVISFVRAKDRGSIGPRFGSWLQDVRRLNVACTRARRGLLLVGHADTLRRLGTNRDGTPRDANAVPAVDFYRNLFDLFEGPTREFQVLYTLGEGQKR